MSSDPDSEAPSASDFIRQRIREDLADGTAESGVVTRFPPEPNGYLHIGHAKSICLNFGVAEEFGGACYLRFDDTNPANEDLEYTEAIQHDVRWLGFDWGTRLSFASDYFEALYQFAEQLVQDGKAFVDSSTAEEIRAARGTLTEPGVDSPYRTRGVEENLALFRAMRAGEYADGEHVLRARIDMGSANLNLRDPVLYRIRHISHQRTGERWCIYPTYDFTHCICDALEGITHSLCTLEFEDHRPLYDWVLDNINVNFHPPQIEFSRLGLEYTVMSKRLLAQLVAEQRVSGWDDPRMPTLAGLRRRGVTPAAIRDFCGRIGVTKQDNRVEMGLLEFCIRKDLEPITPRLMAVLDPLKVVIDNYPADQIETLGAPWHPQNPEMGEKSVPFGAELFIERDDFSEQPPRKYRRLSEGEMVRLRGGYIIRCDAVVRDDAGTVIELRCTYFPDSRSGSDISGLKPKGVIHWVAAHRALPARVRLYDRLFNTPTPDGLDLNETLNESSLDTVDALIEPAMADSAEQRFQFERVGYFCRDSELGNDQPPVFNRIVTLRDSRGKGAS